MYAVVQFVIGMLIIHAAWFLFATAGSVIVVRGDEPVERGEWGRAWLLIILSTAVGMALFGFAGFALGLVGLLSSVGFALVLAGVVASTWLGDAPIVSPAFWSRRFAILRAAAAPVPLTLYAVVLILAVPAVLPFIAADVGSGYLPFAMQWAQHHSLVDDVFRRLPYYPKNWVLLYAWFFALGAGRYVAYLSWLGGGLCIVAVAASLHAFASRAEPQAPRRIDLIALLAALPLVFSAVYLRWLTSAMIDPAEAFVLLSAVIAAAFSVRFPRQPQFAAFVLCGGFLVGMKLSFVALLPLLLVVAFVITSPVAGRRIAAIVCLGLLLASSPWYVRAMVYTGDPVSPILNIAFHGSDPNMSKGDLEALKQDLHTGLSLPQRIALPISDVVEPNGQTSPSFREFGTTPLLLLTIPVYGIFLLALLRARGPAPDVLFAGAAAYTVTYWFDTASLGRYTILFMPLLAVAGGYVALWIAAPRFGARGVAAAAAFLLLLAFPVPGSWNFIERMYEYQYRTLAALFPDDPTYLKTHLTGYQEEEYVSSQLAAGSGDPGRVYVCSGDTLVYYFRLHGIEQIGDAVGPARFGDFNDAVQARRLNEYVDRFRIRAFLLRAHAAGTACDPTGFESQAAELGFRAVRRPEWYYDVYVRDHVL
ncbi:MAG TPA: hypothetical protein VHS78_07890 [Candidatus Elarobacter sp.]|jgi:hypothetical protein|nr:hypothetical protein [Candidatus Elarobacter sp.]